MRLRTAIYRIRAWLIVPAMLVIGLLVFLYLTEPEMVDRIYPRF